MSALSLIQGVVFGSAFGDALGAPTEFVRSADEIHRRWPPMGPDVFAKPIARVTDDTQMMLAVGEALLEAHAGEGLTPQGLEKSLRNAFIAWMNDPDNNRAPGMTCMSACRGLERGGPWLEATQKGSKGCGANMRVQPVGLLPLDAMTRAAIAQFQAALTHGHPTALAASDLTWIAIALLAEGVEPQRLLINLRTYALEFREDYHEEWLGNLWQQPGIDSPQAFIRRGWDEVLGVLDRLEQALKHPDYESDPCKATGEGWIAEEALATGLHCFLLYPEDPVKALQRAAVTCGDSDSIACLAGAFAGAYLGIEAFPPHWRERIEYRDRLETLATGLTDLRLTGRADASRRSAGPV